MGIELTNGYIVNNLEGQVEYNKQKIEEHYAVDRVLASVGFNFKGVVAERSDLPDDYTGEIGDAYAVGQYPEYIYWIWSRANPVIGQDTDYWYEFGPLVLRGPTGESTRWYYSQWLSSFDTTEPDGTMMLISNGDVYIAQNGKWVSTINITGPTGQSTSWMVLNNVENFETYKPYGNMLLDGVTGNVYMSDGSEWTYQANIKGAPGAQGERGNGLVILGDDLASVDSLPAPSSVRRDGGYLVYVNGVKHLYCIIGTGTTADPLRWDDLGAFAYTVEVPKTKYYKHTVNLRFNLEWYNSSQYLTVIIINQSPEPITPESFWTEIKNKVSVTPKIDYGNGQWYMLYDISSFSYDWDDWYGYDIYGCIMGSSEGITLSQQIAKDGGILSIYDGVTEL